MVLLLGLVVGCGGTGSTGAGATGTGSGGGMGAPGGASPSVVITPPPPGPSGLRPRGPTEAGFRVSRVVDGDTVWVARNGVTVKVRLIGIDTPETVHPSEPVGCFGPEATAYAQSVLLDRPATLEYDPSQDRVDAYGRRLAYLWLDGTTAGDYLGMFNLDAIRGGFAREYLYDQPYAWYPEFVAAQDRAAAEGLGLWAVCPQD